MWEKVRSLSGLNIPDSNFFQESERFLELNKSQQHSQEPFVPLKLSLDISVASVCSLENILITLMFLNVCFQIGVWRYCGFQVKIPLGLRVWCSQRIHWKGDDCSQHSTVISSVFLTCLGHHLCGGCLPSKPFHPLCAAQDNCNNCVHS